jgi:hypothetical protein
VAGTKHTPAAHRSTPTRCQVVSLNGTRVVNMRQLVALVDACREPFLHFTLDYDQKVGAGWSVSVQTIGRVFFGGAVYGTLHHAHQHATQTHHVSLPAAAPTQRTHGPTAGAGDGARTQVDAGHSRVPLHQQRQVGRLAERHRKRGSGGGSGRGRSGSQRGSSSSSSSSRWRGSRWWRPREEGAPIAQSQRESGRLSEQAGQAGCRLGAIRCACSRARVVRG